MSHVEEIKRFITGELAPDVEAETLPEDYDIVANGILDSLALVRLVAWVGERYDIAINDLNLAPADFTTVRKIEAFISRHRRFEVA